MDIDKQINSLERVSLFQNESTRVLVLKIISMFLFSLLLVYIIKPVYILDIKHNQVDDTCNHSLLKKRFIIVSSVVFVSVFLANYYLMLL